jgi:hypothetical protein
LPPPLPRLPPPPPPEPAAAPLHTAPTLPAFYTQRLAHSTRTQAGPGRVARMEKLHRWGELDRAVDVVSGDASSSLAFLPFSTSK